VVEGIDCGFEDAVEAAEGGEFGMQGEVMWGEV